MKRPPQPWLDSLKTAWRSCVTPLVNRGIMPVPRPYHLIYVTTRPCNSRCIMCYLWEEKRGNELSVEELRGIFKDNDFTSLTALTLTGGEATLRRDLAELFGVIANACPKLHQVTLATNALDSRRVVKQVKACLNSIPENSAIKIFSVQVSVDGIGEVHDRIRGISGYFDRVMETVRLLKELAQTEARLTLKLSCTVQPSNLDSVHAVESLAKESDLPIHFGALVISPGYYSNLTEAQSLQFTPQQVEQAAATFNHLADANSVAHVKFYYRDVARMVRGAKRSQTCMLGYYGLVLEHNGNIYSCLDCENRSFGNLREHRFRELWWGAATQELRREIRANCCPNCQSVCYVFPKDPVQVADIGLHRLIRRLSTTLQD